MDTRLDRAKLLITTAWVGSGWTVGYLVAPTLFKTLPDSALAGTVAGQLFNVQAWFSIFCALVVIAITRIQKQPVQRVVIGMLACTLLGYFALHPFMALLREQGLTNPDVKWKFGALHGLASGIFLMQSILGAILVLSRLGESGQR